MGVSKNSGTPKSSILIGFSIINHPFWGTPIFGNTQIDLSSLQIEVWTCFAKKWHYSKKVGTAAKLKKNTLKKQNP